MSIIAVPFVFTAGAVIVASEHNSNFSTIYNDYNGSIVNANISASAAIVDTKLATISTAGKVNISALTVASQATGDIIYASSASAWARLATGTATQVLHGGTTPSYSAIVSADLPNGAVLQAVNTSSGAVSTGTTAIPYDDTIPQNTEGTEFMTLAITPNATTNKLLIQVVAIMASTSSGNISGALFQDTTANALAATSCEVAAAGVDKGNVLVINHFMAAGTTSATTFKFRAGNTGGDTVTFNGAAGGRKFGGVASSSITITEIKSA